MDDDEVARYLASYLDLNRDDFISVYRYDDVPISLDIQALERLITKFYADLC